MITKTNHQDSQYARSLIEASLDPLITINTDGKITDMNEALTHITGLPRVLLTGTDFFDYFTEPEKARLIYKEVFSNGSVADSPLTISHTSGKLTDVLFNGSVYRDETGKVRGVVVVARDVTSQKNIARKQNEDKVFAELSTEIAEKAKDRAESATKVAEDAVIAKQQFLSNMSHEIRTPMNAIIGFTKVMLRTDLSPRQQDYLNAIKTSGDSLIVLINDILDLAKVDAGKMAFEKTPFKMASSISSMLNLFETKILEKNLELVKDYDSTIPDVLVGDPTRLHQIILNLVSNAVKFTAEGKITVSVKKIHEDDHVCQIRFSVSDSGIGIPAEHLPSIFENFQQASSDTTRLYGGTGLGLAIVKQLVEGQQGRIAVSSTPGVGSDFTFTLTFQKSEATVEAVNINIDIDRQLKNIRILVVEDIKLNQLLMKAVLDDFGFDWDIASDGKDAIDKLQQRTYDMVLMDLQMPVMNGFETTRYIRTVMRSAIPIIALTADVTTMDLKKCTEVGMNDYVSKPIDEKVLYNKVVTQLKISEASREQEQLRLLPAGKEGMKHIDLTYLENLTKSDAGLMMKMISLYLEQTPPLIKQMKASSKKKDWKTLHAVVHKIIPSFAIMGINAEFERMAKQIVENTFSLKNLHEIPVLVPKLEHVFLQVCAEASEKYNQLKTTENEKQK
jgi:PAS domain S-box-containing protein